jgi:hypothetical protein
MQLFDPNNPNERKKMIAAGALFVVAVAVLGYVFFGGSSKPPTNSTVAKPAPTPTKIVQGQDPAVEDPSSYRQIVFNGTGSPSSEGNRNIFAYYEPPPPTPKPVIILTPTPTPVPPMAIRALNPSTVYARTADFSLEVTGEKFTPAVRVSIDGRELPTRFMNAQQLFATVPAALISTPGVRNVIARASAGNLYSNQATINVTPPPLPNYTYVGIIGRPRGNDTVVLLDKGSKDQLNVQRGDVVGGRFRVSSISEREVVLIDTTLKIRHTIPFAMDTSIPPQNRPPVRRVDSEEPIG